MAQIDERLVSAAPALLSACQAALADIESLGYVIAQGSDGDWRVYSAGEVLYVTASEEEARRRWERPVLAVLRAAIAQARGKAAYLC